MAKLFSELNLQPSTKAALRALGFERMTPVQAAVLPYFLANSDVSVEACTGSGKTLAYAIPVVERLLRSSRPWLATEIGGIILAPTRELARQIAAVVEKFCCGTPLKVSLLVGGTDVAEDVRRCSTDGCNIVVGTPGRLLDVISRDGGAIVIKSLEVLVLDEADQLLSPDMSDAITAILGKLPKQRRTGLFSATQTREVKALARAGLRNPAVISVAVQHHAPVPAPSPDEGVVAALAGVARAGRAAAAAPSPPAEPRRSLPAAVSAASAPPAVQSTPVGLTNYFQLCATPLAKLAALLRFLALRATAGEKVIVFVLTCASVDFYGAVCGLAALRAAAGLPPAADFPILPLHGKMAPKKRTGVFDAFVASGSGALLCTDVAARGIDVPDVDWICQFDPPKDPAFYIHRVGRTARAGRSGRSLLLLLPKEQAYLQLLIIKNVPIQAWSALLPVAPAGVAAAADVYDDPENVGTAVCTAMQAAAVADRDVLEKGSAAFVAFVRGYSEHLLKYVFRFDALDVPSLASAFGLVKLPKVDELRGKRISFAGVPDVDTAAIGYKDPAREKQRQARLARDFDSLEKQRVERDARREKALKEQALAEAGAAPALKRKRQHHGVQARIHEDWEQLAREERLEKRLRQGRISKSDYKSEMAKLNRDGGIEDDDGLADAAVAAVPTRREVHADSAASESAAQ